ncbi:hypothetical protein [Acrocarpospora sp. B8E8]|uniref:hypothetical protein n=1 Tax=Acrocarpospora sp. B8E8 TaxID=3153572 RepID=UPI00325ECC75
MSAVFIILHDVECAACGVADRLWQEVLSGLIECRACGDRVVIDADGRSVATVKDLEEWGVTDFGDDFGHEDGYGDGYGDGSRDGDEDGGEVGNAHGSWDRPFGDWCGGVVWGAR